MRKSFLISGLMVALFCGCKQKAGEGNSLVLSVDHRDPVNVIKAVSEAARQEKAFLLQHLCDTIGQTDSDVQRICELTDTTLLSAGFIHSFRYADQSVNLCRQDSVAEFTFMYGPGMDKCGEWVLIRRGENWYLRELR